MRISNTSQKSEILALIPARSGSKSVPDKNIRLVGGKPMLAHSIAHAQASELITRTIVSTDSQSYAEIARTYGAEVPFLRPLEYAGDLSTDLEVFKHTLQWLAEHENYQPDICVHLRPTYPIRNPHDIDAAIQNLLDNPDIDSIRSVTPAPETPFKMWFQTEDDLLTPAVTATDIEEAYNMPRQVLPQAYVQNACIDVVRTQVILQQNSMTGKHIKGYVMNDFHDVDTETQLQAVQDNLTSIGLKVVIDNTCPSERCKTFVVDIDGIIASITPNNQYDLAEPLLDNIDIINKLHESGHTIILFTARGTTTGIDWREVTEKQLIEWNVKHDKLMFGKPAADYYIDDKLISIDMLKSHCMQHHTIEEKEKQ